MNFYNVIPLVLLLTMPIATPRGTYRKANEFVDKSSEFLNKVIATTTEADETVQSFSTKVSKKTEAPKTKAVEGETQAPPCPRCPQCPQCPKFQCPQCPECSPSPRRECENGWTYFNDSCYKRFLIENTWQAAEWKCQAHGGHLASIGSEAENEFIVELAETTHYGWHAGQPWIGYFRNNMFFEWSDQSVADYKNWGPGEPNNSNGNELCTFIFADSSREDHPNLKGTWNDYACDQKMKSFICKVSIDM